MLAGMLLAIVCIGQYTRILDGVIWIWPIKHPMASKGNAVINKDKIGNDSAFTSTTLKTLIDGSTSKKSDLIPCQ